MTSQDPVMSQSHTFQDHHGDVRSRLDLRARRDRVPRGRTVCFQVFLAFSDCSPAFPCLTVSFFLSWEVSAAVSFSCLTSLFVCARARAFLFCSGWLLDFPAPFPSSQYVIPLENTHAWRVLTAEWFFRHMYSLTKWKCDTDAVMSE